MKKETSKRRYLTGFALIALLLAGICPSWVSAQTSPTIPAIAEPNQERPVEVAPEPPGAPFSLGVTYYLFSDYVSRGVNYSEYAGEGREKLNHQLATSVDVPLGCDGKYGTFGFDIFFEWFAAQKELDPEYGGQNLQEVDYTLRWSYDLDAIDTTLTIGWADFVFPNIKTPGNDDRTNECFISLEHNDAWLWRGMGYQGEDGVLNPRFFFAQDLHISRGYWVEIGLSHPFDVCKNLTCTPSITFALDGGYLETSLNGGNGRGSLEYAYTQYGLDLTYDLTEALHLPPQAGSVFVSGQLFFNDASKVEENRNIIQDEFYGGMAMGWTW
jgi:hypothetical protein